MAHKKKFTLPYSEKLQSNEQTNKQTNCVDPLIFQSHHKMSQTSPMSRSKHEPIFEYDSSFSQLPDLVSVILGQLSTQELLKNTP